MQYHDVRLQPTKHDTLPGAINAILEQFPTDLNGQIKVDDSRMLCGEWIGTKVLTGGERCLEFKIPDSSERCLIHTNGLDLHLRYEAVYLVAAVMLEDGTYEVYEVENLVKPHFDNIRQWPEEYESALITLESDNPNLASVFQSSMVWSRKFDELKSEEKVLDVSHRVPTPRKKMQPSPETKLHETKAHLSEQITNLLEEWDRCESTGPISDENRPLLLKSLGIEARDYLKETMIAIRDFLADEREATTSVFNVDWAPGLGKSYLKLLLVALMGERDQTILISSSRDILSQLIEEKFVSLNRPMTHLSTGRFDNAAYWGDGKRCVSDG